MSGETWLILGASSSMARAFARALAERGAALYLAGRDAEDLTRGASDCRLRGAPLAEILPFDARRDGDSVDILSLMTTRMGAADGTFNVACFVGAMPAQPDVDADPALLDGLISDNFTGPARLIHRLAPLMEARGAGAVVGVGSVAGDRGRLGNYAYGAAKSAFHTYLSGLRNRMARSGVHVMTVKPGFVDTAMTWDVEGMFLVAAPDRVARDILKGLEKRRNVIYTPGFWRLVMTIIRLIPEAIFKRMKI